MILQTDNDQYFNTDKVLYYSIEKEIVPKKSDDYYVYTLTAHFNRMCRIIIAKSHDRQDVASKLDAILAKANGLGVRRK